jgi:putative redox protein
MLEVTSQLKQKLQVEVHARGVASRLDERIEDGGDGAGLSPQETLLAALSACAAMTLRVYAQRKQWPLTGVRVRATLERPAPAAAGAPAAPVRIVQHVTIEGALDADQRKRLVEIAGKCPVHKLLEGPLHMEERLA